MRLVKKVLPIFILAVMILYLLNMTDHQGTARLLSLLTPLTASFLFFLQLVTLCMTAFIWYYLVNLEGRKISYINVFRINSAAGFIESITPSAKLGGEAAKIILFKRFSQMSSSKMVSLTLVKSAVTFTPFFALMLFVFSGSLFFFRVPLEVVYSLSGLTIIAVPAFIIMFKCELTTKLYRLGLRLLSVARSCSPKSVWFNSSSLRSTLIRSKIVRNKKIINNKCRVEDNNLVVRERELSERRIDCSGTTDEESTGCLVRKG